MMYQYRGTNKEQLVCNLHLSWPLRDGKSRRIINLEKVG